MNTVHDFFIVYLIHSLFWKNRLVYLIFFHTLLCLFTLTLGILMLLIICIDHDDNLMVRFGSMTHNDQCHSKYAGKHLLFRSRKTGANVFPSLISDHLFLHSPFLQSSFCVSGSPFAHPLLLLSFPPWEGYPCFKLSLSAIANKNSHKSLNAKK